MQISDGETSRKRRSDFDGEAAPPKLSKNEEKRLYAPPTTQELNELRETEHLFNSNILRLQINELLREVNVKKKVRKKFNAWLDNVKSHLMSIPSIVDGDLINPDTEFFSCVLENCPAPVDRNQIKYISLYPPVNVELLGLSKLGLTVGQIYRPSVVITIPANCFNPKDYLNGKYTAKRNIYLSYILTSLHDQGNCSQICYVKANDFNTYALCKVKNHKGIEVEIIVVPEVGTFPLYRLDAGKVNMKIPRTGNAAYTESLAYDWTLLELERNFYGCLEPYQTLKDGLKLFLVWLKQRNLPMSPQLAGSFAMKLMQKNRINKFMSSYQIVRNMWLELAKSNWLKAGNDGEVEFLADCCGRRNLASDLDKFTYALLKEEASSACSLLDSGGTDAFIELFIQKVLPQVQFDMIIRVNSNADLSEVMSKLKFGLGSRIQHLVHLAAEPTVWPLGQCAPVHTATNCFGVRFDASKWHRIIDRCGSKDEEAAFRSFWMDRSELRRFRDGDICEALVWAASSGLERRRIVGKVVRHTLKEVLHLEHFSVSGLEAERAVLPGLADERHSAAVKALDRLRKLVCALKLPLEVVQLQGASESFAGTDPHPPYSGMGQNASLETLEEAGRVPQVLEALPVVVQLARNSRWPEDLHGVLLLLSSFYLEMARQLRSLHRLVCRPARDHLDVLFDQLVFRLVLSCPKRIALMKKTISETGLVAYKDSPATFRVELEHEHWPALVGALAGLGARFTSFQPAARLLRRWLRAHLLDERLFPGAAADLLVASLFTRKNSRSPVGPEAAFLAALQLLSRLPSPAPLVCDFHGDLNQEQIDELAAKLDDVGKPALHIVTAIDSGGSVFTRTAPDEVCLRRAALLANCALERVTQSSVRSMFTPNLNGYDVLVHLKSCMNPRRWQKIGTKKMPPETELDTNQFPIVDFDPVRKYLQELRECYDHFALFFHDSHGGNVIGVLWRPNVCNPLTEFKVAEIKGHVVDSNDKLVFNSQAVLEDFEVLGEGVVERLEVRRTP